MSEALNPASMSRPWNTQDSRMRRRWPSRQRGMATHIAVESRRRVDMPSVASSVDAPSVVVVDAARSFVVAFA